MIQSIVPDKTILVIYQGIRLHMWITPEPSSHILFHIIVRHGGIRPLVSFSRRFTRRIIIIKQYKVFSQLVLIRRNAVAINAKLLIAIALWHIAQYLVVGAVFFNDIDHMLKHRWFA